jgi:hypothetical protein
MTEITGVRPHGSPCWLELGVPDLETAVTFYGSVLGWEFDRGSEENGYYTMARVGDRVAAALAPAQAAPYFWNPYFASGDVDGTAKLVEQQGGTVVAGPFDVFTAGRMAVAKDPADVPFGLWQGREMPAFGIVAEPGALCWLELGAAEPGRSVAFYSAVLERPVEPMGVPGLDYWTVGVDGQPHAGIWGSAEAPQQWTVYFGVADADAAAVRAADSGGRIVAEPKDSPYGRFAMVSDPAGVVFAVLRPAG